MNQLAVVVASVALSAGVAFAVTQLADPAPAAPPATADPAAIDALRTELAAIGDRLDELARDRVVAAPADRSAVPEDLERRIARAVDAALRTHAAPDASPEAPVVEVDTAVVELLETGVADDGSYAIWKRIREAGKVDEVIAAFERRAAENPGSADAQADLGEAYIAQIMHAENTMEQAQVSLRADAAYDKALEVDPTHWRARFNKAVSYSYWPPITGKPAEAVTHLETLVAQQEARPAPDNDGYPQTYVILGTLLEQQGKKGEAKAVWERGLAVHPGSEALQGKVDR